MYWNNPLIDVTWPSDLDPILQLSNGGQHLLYYDPAFSIGRIKTDRSLDKLCQWANDRMCDHGVDEFLADQNNHYDIANLVKINIWVHDIRHRGIIKPFLILDQGHGGYFAGTGDTRLMVLQCLPDIVTVRAFVSTHTSNRQNYRDLEHVSGFDRFAEICGAVSGQRFLFRPTDDQADYGLYWYEYDSELTRSITPGESWCVQVFGNYVAQHSQITINPGWFSVLISWQDYVE